jgi:RimJ/RimL family protein N-acetyltransferase
MILACDTPDEQIRLLTWMGHFIGEAPRDLVGDMPFNAMGVVRDGVLIGGIVYFNYRRASIEFHLAGPPGWAASIERADISALFAYPFETLGCRRVWCMIRRNNKAARRGAEVLGFKLLGVADDEFGRNRDGIIYSMRRRDCRWISQEESPYGRQSPIVAAADATGSNVESAS